MTVPLFRKDIWERTNAGMLECLDGVFSFSITVDEYQIYYQTRQDWWKEEMRGKPPTNLQSWHRVVVLDVYGSTPISYRRFAGPCLHNVLCQYEDSK